MTDIAGMRPICAKGFWFLLTVLLTGCADSAQQSTDTTESNRAAKSPAASEPSTGTAGKEGGKAEKRRLKVGAFSFTPPGGWETREATLTTGLVMFAPDRARWKEKGFRANLAVRRRPHPGVSFDRYREILDKTLAQSTEQTNKNIKRYLREVAKDDRPVIAFKEKGEYSLDERKINGVRVLSTTFVGVFKLPTGLVATKTHGMQFLDSDALYSISLTFPREFEKEMDAVWASFEKDVRIEK